MKQILIVVPSLSKSGGLERVACMIANDLSAYPSLKIVVISLNSSDSFYAINNDIQVIGFHSSFKLKPLKIVPLFCWLVFKILKVKPDTILSFGEGHNSFVIAASLLLNIRNVFVFNRASPISSLKGFRGVVNPFFYAFANYLIVQTKQAKKILKKKYHNSKIEVIPNPISIISDSTPMDKKKKKILNVGYLGGQKNQNLLIDFYTSIHKKNDDWTLHFIGDGPQRKHLEDTVKKLNLSNKIFFHGKLKDISAHYDASSIFAFTSHTEGFPNVLAEAMSYGCACISFDCISGPSDLIDNNHNGFLINIGDHSEYIHKLNSLMENAELRETFSQHALLKVMKFKRSDIISKLYTMIIED